MVTFPMFHLTAEEETSFQTDLLAIITSIRTILTTRPAPLSVYDWSEALRHVRDAFATAADMHDLGDETPQADTRLATLFLYKGDCFRGLGRLREARDAYVAACRVECQSREDAVSQSTAIVRLERLEAVWSGDDARAKRLAGLWNALNTGVSDPDLSVLGYETELWDPEPRLVVRSLAGRRRPRKVESRFSGAFWGLKYGVDGFVGVKMPGLRSRKHENVNEAVRMVGCAA